MAEQVFPASPNWYCSKVIAGNSSGALVFGAKHDVYVFDVQRHSRWPNFCGIFTRHGEKITSLELCQIPGHLSLCCSASEDGTIKVWDIKNKEEISENRHSNKVTALSWSPIESEKIVSGDEKGVIAYWEYRDKRAQTFMPEKNQITCIVCSTQSTSEIAVGYKTGLILIIDLKKGAEVINRLRGHDEEIHCLVWCPVPGECLPRLDLDAEPEPDSCEVDENRPFGADGCLLASGSRDATIRVWSSTRGRELVFFKLGSAAGQRRGRVDDQGRNRLWLTLHWPRSRPTDIISGSFSGNLFVWDVTKHGRQKPSPFSVSESQTAHNRIVFNLCSLGPDQNIMCSSSLDRQVIIWDLSTGNPLFTLPTMGGFIYIIRASPVDPGRFAVGVGDNIIRIWNLNSHKNQTDITNLWQGIRSKVTALSWHPVKENLLAYGTDDGRVGIYDVMSFKSPQISSTYHKRTVYVVSWGPPCSGAEGGDGSFYVLYSVGDGVVLMHNPYRLNEEASDLNNLIQETNGKKHKLPIRSEVSWTPDYQLVAIGNDDGSVELFRPPDMKLVCIVHVHHKLVNCVSWHPYKTSSSPHGSPYTYWMATGSNECFVQVIDATEAFSRSGSSELLVITASKWKLDEHTGRITALAWNPHKDGILATASYDSRVYVWDVGTGSAIACYQGHMGRLLSVQWSGIEADVLITGGEDFSLRKWKLDSHRDIPEKKEMKRKRKVKTKPVHDREVEISKQATVVDTDDSFVNISLTAEERSSIEILLAEKRKELLTQQLVDGSGDASNPAVEASDQISNEDTAVATDKFESSKMTHSSSSQNVREVSKPKPDSTFSRQKIRKKIKSYFPLSGQKENRGKAFMLQDIVTLAEFIYGQEKPQLCEDNAHLGLFLDRRGVYKCLKQEGQCHRDHDNMEYYLELEIWKGNINSVLRLASEQEELSDWLVAMAPMVSFDTWVSVCTDYALQLELEGQFHKGATYLLACHKVYDAIELFTRHRLFKEAIALAKVRLSPVDPLLEELYTQWAIQLTKDGNYEQAAKCHLAMRQVQDAAKLLARRYDQSNLKTATQVSMIANDRKQGLLYAQRVVHEYLLQGQWSSTYEFLGNQNGLQPLLVTSSLHELLIHELVVQQIDIPGLDLESCEFSIWDKKLGQTSILPAFMIDPEDIDPMSPWPPYLLNGHAFVHHVLRIWYSHLGIAMDTKSLEDMYKTLSLLHAGKQTQVDLKQLLIQISLDLVLCLLSLLMSETPTAISHLLQAIGSIHELGNTKLLQLLLKLFLPQGPKYILKLQQEVTAMRVVISMDNSSDFNGASKIHTIKRYLSEIKEDASISSSGVRCRELDCLRAYYYLGILYHLRESLEVENNDIEHNSFSSKAAEIGNQESQKVEFQVEKTKLGTLDNLATDEKIVSGVVPSSVNNLSMTNPQCVQNSNLFGMSITKNVGSDQTKLKIENTGTDIMVKDVQNMKNIPDNGKIEKSEIKAERDDGTTNSNIPKCQNSPRYSLPMDKLKIDQPIIDQGVSLSQKTTDTSREAIPVLSHSDLEAISPVELGDPVVQKGHGILQDITCEFGSKEECPKSDYDVDIKSDSSAQSMTLPKPIMMPPHNPCSDIFLNTSVDQYVTIAKLGHLSRGLLWDLQAKRYALTETLGYIHKAISQLLLAQKPNSVSDGQNDFIDNDGNLFMGAGNDGMMGNISRETSEVDGRATMYERSFSAPATGNAFENSPVASSTNQNYLRSRSAESTSNPYSQHAGLPRVHSLPQSTMDIHLPHIGHITVPVGHTDENSVLEVCSSCELLTKSRKVLWEDEPQWQYRLEQGARKMTSIVNPAKYINVPDEWYNMPANRKYFMPYVTMAILKDEQEYVVNELKRGPDSIQVPFPSPLESLRLLLEVCQHSQTVTAIERQQFAEKVIKWALNFAVTTQQKEQLHALLHLVLNSNAVLNPVH